MSNWITVTVDDIPAYLVSVLATALRTKVLAVGQTDPLPGIIEDVCDSIRLQIAGCKTNLLDVTEHTIPKEIKRHAIALIVEAALPRLKIDLSEDQRRAADNARTYLQQVTACKIPVSKPDTAEPVPEAQSQGGLSVVTKQTRRVTGRSLDGI